MDCEEGTPKPKKSGLREGGGRAFTELFYLLACPTPYFPPDWALRLALSLGLAFLGVLASLGLALGLAFFYKEAYQIKRTVDRCQSAR